MKSHESDDASVGYEQARQLLTMRAANIDQGRLWLYFFSIGGSISEFELDAFLHHSLVLPRLQRDLLAQAANEILAEQAPPRVPYAADILRHRNPPVYEATPNERDDPEEKETVEDWTGLTPVGPGLIQPRVPAHTCEGAGHDQSRSRQSFSPPITTIATGQ